MSKKYLKYDHISKGNVDPSLNRDVKHLYLKYKNKYLNLKQQIGGATGDSCGFLYNIDTETINHTKKEPVCTGDGVKKVCKTCTSEVCLCDDRACTPLNIDPKVLPCYKEKNGTYEPDNKKGRIQTGDMETVLKLYKNKDASDINRETYNKFIEASKKEAQCSKNPPSILCSKIVFAPQQIIEAKNKVKLDAELKEAKDKADRAEYFKQMNEQMNKDRKNATNASITQPLVDPFTITEIYRTNQNFGSCCIGQEFTAGRCFNVTKNNKNPKKICAYNENTAKSKY